MTDTNKDGVVNYQDVLTFKMAENSSPAKDAIQPFLSTLLS